MIEAGDNGRARGVIVTGAAHGIGAATARYLARRGWGVVCADIDGEAAAPVVGEAGGIAVTCDVGSQSDVERLVALARTHLGRIDAVVSNAGVSRFKPFKDTTLEDWNGVLATNLTATFLLAKAAAADLEQARGSIVAIASTRAHMSEPGTLAYSATKGGLVALTHSLAITLGPAVRVNCVSPGWGSRQATTRRLKPSDHAQHPVGRRRAGRRTWRRPLPICCRRRRVSSRARN